MTRSSAGLCGDWLAALLLLGALGCASEASKPNSGPDTGPAGTAGSATVPDPPLTGDVGSIPVHQLTAREYDNTARDLLATTLTPGTAFQQFEAEGFDTLAAAGVMNSRKVSDYFSAAGVLADDLFADPARRASVVTCEPTVAGDTACADGIIKTFGLRAWRRPLEAAEVADLVSRYQAALALGLDHAGALRQVVRILLASPQFIYRIEFDPDPTTVHPLSGYELASRLSYLMWSSMPDSALFAAAADGGLQSTERRSGEVDRLLADTRSRELVDNFAAQWLGARRLNGHVVDPAVYPAFSPALGAAMQREMAAYFDEFLHGELTYDKFLTANVNFVDSGLAALYGLADPGSASLTRVQNDMGQRVGFLGLAGFLTHTSRMERTAPSIRGKWVVNSLKCLELELPANLNPAPLEPGAGQTVRQVLEAHRASPACAGCHNILDPVGLALEHFDAIGRYRATYTDGLPVDSVGTLTDGSTFDGLVQLADAMSKDPGFVGCAAHKLFVYGLGRTVAGSEPYLDGITADWQARGLSLRNLLKAIAASDAFRLRHGN